MRGAVQSSRPVLNEVKDFFLLIRILRTQDALEARTWNFEPICFVDTRRRLADITGAPVKRFCANAFREVL